jgi:predicted GTPase
MAPKTRRRSPTKPEQAKKRLRTKTEPEQVERPLQTETPADVQKDEAIESWPPGTVRLGEVFHIGKRRDKLHYSPQDFENLDESDKRLIVVGCTGAGKSTMLNIMAGWTFESIKDEHWNFTTALHKKEAIDGPLFKAGASAESTTTETSFALVNYFNDPGKQLIVIDTPGHDDTGGADRMVKIEADLHNKLQMIRYVNAILVIHNDVKGNVLNPATLELLEKIDAKFKDAGVDVWDHVMIGYSKCNAHVEDWRANLDKKIKNMQAAIRQRIPTCKKDVPIVPLGGMTGDGKEPIGRPDQNDGFNKVWYFVNTSKNLPTKDVKPFKGIAEKHKDAVLLADEERRKRRILETYLSVMVQVALLLALFLFRYILPWWLSMLLFNFDGYFDELLILGMFLWAVGYKNVWDSCQLFYEKWIASGYLLTLLRNLGRTAYRMFHSLDTLDKQQ